MIIHKQKLYFRTQIGDIYRHLKSCRDNKFPVSREYIRGACIINSNHSFFHYNYKYCIEALIKAPIDCHEASLALKNNRVLKFPEVVQYLLDKGGVFDEYAIKVIIKQFRLLNNKQRRENSDVVRRMRFVMYKWAEFRNKRKISNDN